MKSDPGWWFDSGQLNTGETFCLKENSFHSCGCYNVMKDDSCVLLWCTASCVEQGKLLCPQRAGPSEEHVYGPWCFTVTYSQILMFWALCYQDSVLYLNHGEGKSETWTDFFHFFDIMLVSPVSSQFIPSGEVIQRLGIENLRKSKLWQGSITASCKLSSSDEVSWIISPFEKWTN